MSKAFNETRVKYRNLKGKNESQNMCRNWSFQSMGRGIALVLAKEAGCLVYATARDKEALNTLAEEVSQSDSDGQNCTL